MVRGDLEVVAVDGRRHLVVVAEHQRRARVLVEPRLGGRGLHHRPVRREVAAKDGDTGRGRDRPVERADDVIVVDLRLGDGLSERPSAYRARAEIESAAEHRQEPRQAAGIVEVLHQEFAARPEVGDHRHLARDPVEIVEVERHVGPARHRHQVDHRIGGAGERHLHDERIEERAAREHVARLEVLMDHPDDAAAGGARHAGMRGVRRRNR